MFLARRMYQETNNLHHIQPAWYSEVKDYQGNTSYILDMLMRGKGLEASNPRDNVYALLGISTGINLEDMRIAINYHKSCGEVFTDFARYIMETTNDYDILSYIDWGHLRPTEYYWDGNYHRDRVDEDNLWLSQDRSRKVSLESLWLAIERVVNIRNKDKFTRSWVPNWNQKRRITRTILSTLDPESELKQKQRQSLVGKSRIWFGSENTLVILGSIIGEIVDLGPRICLQGKDEMSFQDIRDQYGKDQREVYIKIMNLWQYQFNLRFQTERLIRTTSVHSDLKLPKPKSTINDLWRRIFRRKEKVTEVDRELPNPGRYDYGDRSYGDMWKGLSSQFDFQSLVNSNPDQPRDSVEHHLFTRARKTAVWSDDNSKAVSVITANSSIVDGKIIAIYTSSATSQKHLALLPARTQRDDLIICFRGARVPFVVRTNTEAADGVLREDISNNLTMDEDINIMGCEIVGECLVNGFETSAELGSKNGLGNIAPSLLSSSSQAATQKAFVVG